jgi:hypothetical protein
MSDTGVAVLLVIIGLVSAILAFGIEPHWSSRDGRRFIARAAVREDRNLSSWFEVRGSLTEGGVDISARRGRHRDADGFYRVSGVADGPRRTVVIHLMGSRELLLRFPRRSRTLRMLTADAESPNPNP